MIIIPARMASNRFPNKILADINGLPMVIATAARVSELDRVVIATDSQEVIELANEYGYEAVMTGTHHQSGTDRINEASLGLDIDEDEVIVNVQADEPFIEPDVVKKVIECVKNSDCFMASCYKLIDKSFADDLNMFPKSLKSSLNIKERPELKITNNNNTNTYSKSNVPFK